MKVLCVEDNNDDATLLIAELRRSGYQVEWQRVDTADAFLDALQQAPPDIILSDYSMPSFNGMTALKLLLATGQDIDIPFIIVSANIGEEVAVEAMRLGAADYLFKDRLARLGQAVAAALRAHDLRDEQRRMQKAQRFQFGLQRAIVAISTRFLSILPDQLDEAITNSLRDAGQFVGADYAHIHLNSLDLATITRVYDWCAVDASPIPDSVRTGDTVPATTYAWTFSKLRNLEMVYIRGMQDIPAETITDKTAYEARGAQSLFIAPLALGEVLVGTFTLSAHSHVFDWSDEDLALLKLLADVFANVIVRMQTETILNNERNLLRGLINTVPDPISARDTDGRIIMANTAAADMLGVTTFQMLNRHYEDVRTPEQVQRNQAAAQEVRRTRRPSPDYEEMLVDSAGNKRWLLTTHAPLLDAFAEVTGIVTVSRDITALTLAAEQVKRQLETISALYEGARGLTSLDVQTLLNEATRTCVESFGAKLAWIGRAEPDGRVRLISQFPLESDYPPSITVRWDDTPAGHGPTGRSIRSGAPELWRDILTTPDYAPWLAQARQAGFACGSAFPLTSHAHTYGALMVYFGNGVELTDERAQFFENYSLQLAAAVESARLFEQTERRLEQVQALHTIATAISGSFEQGITLNVILDAVIRQLHVDSAAVLLLNMDTQMLMCAAQRGFRAEGLTSARLPLDRSNAGRAIMERRIVRVDAGGGAGASFLARPPLVDEGFVTYYGVPLSTHGQTLGVLELYLRSSFNPDAEWLQFFEALAAQAAVAVEAYASFNELQNINTTLAQAYEATIEGWSRALELRDRETAGHSQRVVDLTLRVARALGLSDAELVHIRRGALLHDIGKLGIPDNILMKPGPLTEDEWGIMRKHVQYAYDLLKQIPYLLAAIDIPYCHHEWWDGTGYPRGLKGEEIPLPARIFAVVDAWDALRYNRPYREAWPLERVRAYLQEQAGRKFDPIVVKTLLEITRDE